MVLVQIPSSQLFCGMLILQVPSKDCIFVVEAYIQVAEFRYALKVPKL
jgi:hypothetical protein